MTELYHCMVGSFPPEGPGSTIYNIQITGEIKLFAGNYAPSGFMFCHGQLLPVSQYIPLFSLLGFTYGGDGQTTFALPDLRGAVPVGPGLPAGGGAAWTQGEKN